MYARVPGEHLSARRHGGSAQDCPAEDRAGGTSYVQAEITDDLPGSSPSSRENAPYRRMPISCPTMVSQSPACRCLPLKAFALGAFKKPASIPLLVNSSLQVHNWLSEVGTKGLVRLAGWTSGAAGARGLDDSRLGNHNDGLTHAHRPPKIVACKASGTASDRQVEVPRPRSSPSRHVADEPHRGVNPQPAN